MDHSESAANFGVTCRQAEPLGLTIWMLHDTIMPEMVDQPVLVVHDGKHTRTLGAQPRALRRRRQQSSQRCGGRTRRR